MSAVTGTPRWISCPLMWRRPRLPDPRHHGNFMLSAPFESMSSGGTKTIPLGQSTVQSFPSPKFCCEGASLGGVRPFPSVTGQEASDSGDGLADVRGLAKAAPIVVLATVGVAEPRGPVGARLEQAATRKAPTATSTKNRSHPIASNTPA